MLGMVVLFFVILLVIYLVIESYLNDKNRKKFKKIVHVNGIRGKSTVTRLIHSGLKASDLRIFAKTTGTLPMTIDNNYNEELIQRRGKANIKEQIKIIEKAVKNKSDVLVIECMAVNPRLQYVSQNSILKAGIGVLTNVRLDHTEEMGYTLEEICESLCKFIPKNGYLVTSEIKFFYKIEKYCKKVNTKIIRAVPKEEYAYINFPENVACALEVCKLFGIDEESALKSMENFVKDPYDLRLYIFEKGAIFVNGLSINDPDSSEIVYRRLEKKYNWYEKKIILIINNRADRGYRANHMIMLAKKLNPYKIFLCGDFVDILYKKLDRFDREIVKNIDNIDFLKYTEKHVIYAVGNIANNGDKIMEKAKKEGKEYV